MKSNLQDFEKLYEELLIDDASLKKTTKDRIFVACQSIVDGQRLCQDIEVLIDSAFKEDPDIRQKVQKLVPEYVIKEDTKQRIF